MHHAILFTLSSIAPLRLLVLRELGIRVARPASCGVHQIWHRNVSGEAELSDFSVCADCSVRKY
jgi:hypothetical protein